MRKRTLFVHTRLVFPMIRKLSFLYILPHSGTVVRCYPMSVDCRKLNEVGGMGLDASQVE